MRGRRTTKRVDVNAAQSSSATRAVASSYTLSSMSTPRRIGCILAAVSSNSPSNPSLSSALLLAPAALLIAASCSCLILAALLIGSASLASGWRCLIASATAASTESRGNMAGANSHEVRPSVPLTNAISAQQGDMTLPTAADAAADGRETFVAADIAPTFSA